MIQAGNRVSYRIRIGCNKLFQEHAEFRFFIYSSDNPAKHTCIQESIQVSSNRFLSGDINKVRPNEYCPIGSLVDPLLYLCRITHMYHPIHICPEYSILFGTDKRGTIEIEYIVTAPATTCRQEPP